MKFQHIVKQRGRPKLGREGAPSKSKKKPGQTNQNDGKGKQNKGKKKQKVPDFIDADLSLNSTVQRKRGRPSNPNKVSQKREYVRGPYNKKKSKVNSMSSCSSSRSQRSRTGPMRAPHTMNALHRDYPGLASQPSKQPLESCYTCGFKLDRQLTDTNEKVIKCTRCNECDVHASCYKNCRRCEELNLI